MPGPGAQTSAIRSAATSILDSPGGIEPPTSRMSSAAARPSLLIDSMLSVLRSIPPLAISCARRPSCWM
jgi:hypothetical protein